MTSGQHARRIYEHVHDTKLTSQVHWLNCTALEIELLADEYHIDWYKEYIIWPVDMWTVYMYYMSIHMLKFYSYVI